MSESELQTLAELPFFVAARYDRPDLIGHCAEGGPAVLSTQEFCDRIRDLNAALRGMGLQPGDRVAIMSESRPEWCVADLAILSARGVTVPIYPTLPATQAAYILNDAGCKQAFVSDPVQFEKILQVVGATPALEAVIIFDPRGDPDKHPPIAGRSRPLATYALAELVDKRRSHLHRDSSAARAYREEAAKTRPGDLATIIYTSGTTGDPKGVMLTHGNIVSNVLATERVLSMSPSDVALSFLPLSHSFERTVLYKYLHQGVTVRFAESLETVARDLLQVRPTIMTGVPRVFEKFHGRILETVAQSPALRRRLFGWAHDVGLARARAGMAKQFVPITVRVQHAAADRLVLSKVRGRLGGRLRLLVSGSAPLSIPVAEFFHAMGLPLVEGYGLTETSPVLTVNPPEAGRLGTVGPAIPGVELRIDADGEILARGPNIMVGYYKKPDATREVLREGWFHTGDIGQLDARGYLRITDRKKDLIVTSGGKKLAPQPLENALKADPLIAEAVLIGDRRKFPSALIVPDFVALEKRLRELNTPAQGREQLVTRADVIDLYQRIVDRLNADLAQYERIKRFALLPREFTLAGGELTPTMKVKRKVVEERWREQIEAMYEEKGVG